MNFFNTTGGGQMRYPAVATGPAGNLAVGTAIGAAGSYATSIASVVFGSAAGLGQLPHLSKMVQSGVIGNLATLSPCLSPQRGCLRKKSVAGPYGMGWEALE
ncbi:MAG: hypothetical protein WCO86_16630 [Planctomycetota bacterium]